MKNQFSLFSLTFLCFFFFFSEVSYSQTPITDANFNEAIDTCLYTNPVNGMCTSSQYGAMPNWDVSNVTSMLSAFSDRLDFNGDISNWDVSSVANMGRMFYKANDFNQDISNWNVSNVTDMNRMFTFTTFNQDIGNWDVGNVISMERMFYTANTFNQDIGNWDVSNVRDMNLMFRFTPFNQDIGSWDVSNVTEMNGAFSSSPFNQNIGNWDVSNVTKMNGMFSNTPFNEDIGTWDVSNVTDMSRMFSTTAFNQNIGNWDVNNVTNMERMFYKANAFNQDIGNWDVSNVTDMNGMFSNTPFNQDIGDWDVSNVTDMERIFYKAITFNQDISTWEVSNVSYMNRMFAFTPFNQDIGNWDVSSVISMERMFYTANTFNEDIGNWDVSNVTDMNGMFSTSTFNQDIGNWDVSNVTDMSSMFGNSSLSTVNYDAILSGWSTISLQPSVELGATGITYCNGELARQFIIDNFGWNIIDAGLDCSAFDITDPVAICQDITVQLDNNGLASINGINIDGGSTDNVGIVSYTAVPDAFNCNDIGVNTVTLTVTDSSGNTDTCTATVTIEDNLDPNVIGQNAEGDLLGTGSVTIPVSSVDMGSTDNCSIANLSLTPDTFTSVGTFNAVLDVTDSSGNSGFANITITIIDTGDNIDPIAVCQDITVQLDNNGLASIDGVNIDGGSTDNINIVSYTAEPDAFNCNDIGTNTVTLIVTDASGNTDTCTATVTIEDNLNPNVIGQNAEGNLLGTGSVTIPVSSVDMGSTDNCSIANLSLTPDTFTSVGTFNAVLEGTDASGNSDDVSVVITIIDDVLNTLEREFTDFSMYPNPANRNITIDGGENTLLKRLEIFDVTGKQIITKKNEQPTQKFYLDISSLESSVYFVSMIDVNGRKVMRKLIKE
jgi:surface protein